MADNQNKPDAGIQAGLDIPPPESGMVADWLFNRSNFLRQVVAAAVSWLNLAVIVKIKNSDGTVSAMPVARPVITAKNSTLTLFVDLTNLSSAGTSRLRVKDDLGASLKCRSWDGTTEGGTDIFVAKQPCIRNTIGTDVQNGVTFTYSYSLGAADTNGNHYLVRTVSGTDGTTETDDIVPPYIFNCEIYAVAIPSVTLDGNACTYLDTSPRAFAART